MKKYIIYIIVFLLSALPSVAQTPALPDNVDSADCVYLPEAQQWSIGAPRRSTNETALILSTPLVGDVDDDGETEIVITAMPDEGNWWDPDYDPYGRASHINVYRADGLLKRTFAVAPGNVYYTPGLARVRWTDSTYRTIIVTYASNGRFYAYSGTGTQLWISNNTFQTQTGEEHPVPAISFADFNHDGWTEMYAGSEIYDAATGVLLCRDNAGNKGFTDRASHSDRIPYMTMAADLCGDDRLELAAGNVVYDVNLQSRTDMSQNQMTVVHHVSTAGMTMEDGSAIPYHDGNTFLVDIDEDGRLDVLVMYEQTTTRTIFLYVWDVQGDSIICSRKIGNARKFGTPQIGDIDADGHPEVCFVVGTVEGVVAGSNDNIYALKRNPASRQMSIFWTTDHADQSGSTGLTLFDFNQDGIAELIYRDETQMRIINGSLRHHETGAALTEPYNMTTYPCGSSTVMEYPVVADVDGDGEAEIIVPGYQPSAMITSQRTGYIYIFKSGGAQWAPARPVWNQYMYNVTCVNRDLTVPQYLYNNATPFTALDGTVSRPYNNFLQQATTIDVHGQPFSAVADVAADSMAVEYGSEALGVTLYYCNHGSIPLSAPYRVTVFAEAQGGVAAAVATVGQPLPVDSCTSLQITIPYTDLNGVTRLVVAANCAGGGIAQNGGLSAECDTTNNTVSQMIGAHYFYDTIVCENQLPTTWHGMAVTTDSLYMDSLTAVSGMDSIVMMHFVVNDVFEGVDSVVICPGLPFLYHGVDYGGPTSFDLPLTTRAGCDSLVHVTLYERDSNYRVVPFYRIDSLEWLEPDSILTVCAPATLDMFDSTPGAVVRDWLFFTADSTVSSSDEAVSWRFDEGSRQVSAYVSLVVTDPWGCFDTLGWPVVVLPKPRPEFQWERDVPAIDNPEAQFHNLSQPDGGTYLWRIQSAEGGSFDTTSEVAPFYHWGEPGDNMEGDYIVRLLAHWEHTVAAFRTDTLFASGDPRLGSTLFETFTHTCIDSVEHTITITNDYLQFPNLVTPNGDGVNDIWEVKNLLDYGNFSMNELWIYDRTGAQVYHEKDIRSVEQFWDPNATRSPDGTYFYRFTAQGQYGIVKRNGLIEVLR